MDDQFSNDISTIEPFVNRFLGKKPQLHPMLDCFVELLQDMPLHLSSFAADMGVMSVLKMVTALILEHRMRKIKVSPPFIQVDRCRS